MGFCLFEKNLVLKYICSGVVFERCDFLFFVNIIHGPNLEFSRAEIGKEPHIDQFKKINK